MWTVPWWLPAGVPGYAAPGYVDVGELAARLAAVLPRLAVAAVLAVVLLVLAGFLPLQFALRFRQPARLVLEWQLWGDRLSVAREFRVTGLVSTPRGPGLRIERRLRLRLPLMPLFETGSFVDHALTEMLSDQGRPDAQRGRRALVSMLASSRWLSLRWHTALGAGDAALTARLAGALWILKGQLTADICRRIGPAAQVPDLRVEPRFQERLLHTRADCILRIRLKDIIRAARTAAGPRPGAGGQGRGSEGVAAWKSTPSRV